MKRRARRPLFPRPGLPLRPAALATGLVLGFMLGTLARGEPARVPAGTTLSPGFAVLELFTSEGCSSCPAADATLDALGRAARADGQRIFTLAFHVDYWDQLGWPDPFAHPEATERQRKYAATLGGGRIYTPQLVVNGRSELVGSDASRARMAVASALATPGTVHLTLDGDPRTGVARWRVEGAPAGAVLQLALVEGGLAVDVKRGENAGEKLSHDNVVRVFRSLALTEPRGEATLLVPAAARPGHLRLIGYVQDPVSLAILAARRRLTTPDRRVAPPLRPRYRRRMDTPRWSWQPWSALDADAVYAVLALRAQVFVVEQACAYLDPDGLDARAWHLLGTTGEGTLVAYLRAFPPGALHPEAAVFGRVVTAPTHRGAGLGTALMREGLRRMGVTFGPGPVRASAQAHLTAWYAGLGFAVDGPGYDEDGIPHVPILGRLAPPDFRFSS
ncbi:MAG: GNAT family N-acetyltransferase [bacterium]